MIDCALAAYFGLSEMLVKRISGTHCATVPTALRAWRGGLSPVAVTGSPWRAARAPIVKWSAQDAGVEDISKCGLRGSPTIVKRVFAPSPRAEKAVLIDFSGRPPAEALIEDIFRRQPKLEAELAALARGF